MKRYGAPFIFEPDCEPRIREFRLRELDDDGYTQQPVRFTYSMVQEMLARVKDNYHSGRDLEYAAAVAEFQRGEPERLLARLKKTFPEVSYG